MAARAVQTKRDSFSAQPSSTMQSSDWAADLAAAEVRSAATDLRSSYSRSSAASSGDSPSPLELVHMRSRAFCCRCSAVSMSEKSVARSACTASLVEGAAAADDGCTAGAADGRRDGAAAAVRIGGGGGMCGSS